MTEWIISPQAQLSWQGGQWRVVNGTNPNLTYVTEQKSVGDLLGAFARPADPDVVAKQLSDALPGVRDVIYELAALDILVPLASLASEKPNGPSLENLKAIARRKKSLGFLRHDDAGMTITNSGKSNLSPGCQACKDGAWLCVFSGVDCNASCEFCPQPGPTRRFDEEEIGDGWVDRLIEGLEAYGPALKGLSFSGGEPFLYESVVRKIATWAREHLPGTYLWVYTNGILAKEENLQRFRDMGLSEIRFNLAATGFAKKVVKNVGDHAVRIFPWVTVEIPMYAPTFRHLIEEGQLDRLEEIGVKQLNLGQLFAGTPSSAAAKTFGNTFGVPTNPNGMTDATMQIRNWTFDVFEYAYKRGLSIRINDCSDDGKALQVQARQRFGGPDLLELMQLAYPRPSPPKVMEPPPDVSNTGGMMWKLMQPGRGTRKPKLLDTVVVRYISWTFDRRVFESSYPSGLEGVAVRLKSLPDPLAISLLDMVEGERRHLWLDSPKGKVLFELELLAIRPVHSPFPVLQA